MSGSGADGEFIIRYKINSATKYLGFGYYSNGSFLEKLIKTDIQPDTILFKYER